MPLHERLQRHVTLGPLLVAFTTLCIIPATAFSQAEPSGQPRPDGRELVPGPVSVDEGTLFVVCEGEAQPSVPTVVFENGLGAPYTTWRAVQPEIAKHTRTCAYDRLGAGQSDAVSEDDTRTPFELAKTLRDVLSEIGEEGPYVLVGHSIAGLILLAYPHLYPDDIAGLVFVDASHPQQWVRFREVSPESADPIGISGNERIDRGKTTEELSVVGDFGDVPIAVLYQARPTDSPARPIWVNLQRDHASRSTNSRLIPGTESGHFVHLDQPELVIGAIRWVLAGGEAGGDTPAR